MRLIALLAVVPILSLAACGGHADTSGVQVSGYPDHSAGFEIEPEIEQVAAILRAPGLDPSRLKGMSAAQLTEAFGRPVFTRRDLPAEIWQYRGKACMLDLFLYDGTVSHHAVRGHNPPGDRDCLNDLVKKKG